MTAIVSFHILEKLRNTGASNSLRGEIEYAHIIY